MIKSKTLLALTFFAASFLVEKGFAQTFGNEWIDFNQSYFKVKVGKNGIYRITQSDLNSAGFPVSSVDPRRIQVFKNGIEQAIFIQGQSDGIFHSNDYLEFYGEINDGTTDTELYTTPSAQPHTFYSLFSDSAVYFITYKLSAETGKRMASFSENNVTNIPADSYYLEDTVTVFFNNYSEGRSYGSSNKVLIPQYDFGEGFTGSPASTGQSLDFTIANITNTFTSAIKPRLEVLLVGRNNNQHSVDILVGTNVTSLRNIATANFNKDDNFLVSSEIEWSDISATGNLSIRATVNGVGGNADRASISYIRLVYPRSFDLANQTMKSLQLQTNASDKSYIEVSNPPGNITLLDVTDTNNPVIIGTNESFQTFNAVIPNTANERTLWVQGAPFTPNNIETVTFQNIDASLYNYLIISNKMLQSSTSGGQPNPIESYKNYRESTDGGNHSVIVQNIEDVFDQFNYGLPSPLAIRRYSNYMLSGGNPEFLFLIGRASDIGNNFYRQAPGTALIENLVPTYGFPGSDAAFTTGLNGTSIYSAIATGRINATSPDHVQVYLDKVIETESAPIDNLRKKSMIHLSGGLTQSELNIFKSYINGFKSIAEAPLLGGLVAQSSKNSNDAVELINISDEINNGVILVTFFGHSSVGITDIEVGTVSDPSFGYANQGKYPIFLVNGCQAGDFFGANVSFGVDWVLTPNLGALGFLAHSDVGFSGPLRNYSNLFYTIGFSDENFIGGSLGKIIQETGRRYAQTFGTDEGSIGQVQLLNLQGDPAIKLFGADKPDYDVDDNNFETNTFDGSALLIDTDSFYVDINVRNYGIVPSDPFNVIVRRTLNNGSITNSDPITFDPVLNSDTIRIVIDNQIDNNEGLNSFEVILDPFNEIEELDEQNNSLAFDLFFATGSTQNLFPVNNGVVQSAQVTFLFQSTNLLSGTRSFDFQLDTLSSFNSPYLIEQTINTDVVGQIPLNLSPSNNIPEGIVFYWRTKFTNPSDDEDANWVVSSFTYNSSETASWMQSSPVQFKDFELAGLSLDTISGVWDFFSNVTKLELTTYGPNHPTFNELDTHLSLNGQNYFVSASGQVCRDNTINFVAFDNQTTVPINPIFFNQFDLLNPLLCGIRPQLIYNYTEADIGAASGPEEFIDNMQSGDQVVVFTIGQVNFSTWTNEFKLKLEELGVNRTTLDNMQNGEPAIFFGKKGSDPNSAIEVLSTVIPKIQQGVSLDIDVTGSFGTGSLQTQRIGPATGWSSLENEITLSTNPAQDVRNITVIGIDRVNNETNLIVDSPDSQIDLSSIDAILYPYLKIKVNIEDEQDFTPPQLENWKVFYDEAPEGILLNRNPLNTSSRTSDLQEGETLTSNFTFWNLSQSSFADSLKVNFETLNNVSGVLTEDSLKISPPLPGDSTNFSLTVSTLGKVGSNDLFTTVNQNEYIEIYASNNSIRLTDFFNVTADQTNPILEVSFDGLYILDGDIVSPNPSILIRLKDDNQFIFKSDTLGVNLFLKSPCEECDFERVAFSNPNINWTSATENSDFSVEYRPENLINGIHSLRVQAQDASGNNSGLEPYEINFEVINESTVTNFYPYPNPFSTSTRFVFTLTGSTIPDDIKIQIMTVTGRVVKEIFREELGTIRIGNNMTDYAWDGRDNYGDQLANGVYLYRVIIQNAGENFDKRSVSNTSTGDEGTTDIDGRAFKNGFGKLYLLR